MSEGLVQRETAIVLYTSPAPDCIKISIVLEELGLQYDVRTVDCSRGEQKLSSFIEVNPNGRIPALTDIHEDGHKIYLFESGSIMQYLIHRYDTEHMLDLEVNNWVFFQNAGITPMQGQATHFLRYAPCKIDYAISRYQNEVCRLYSVLETRLAQSKSGYLVGDKCTIADIAHWSWISSAFWAGIDIERYPVLKRWESQMLARPGLERGQHVPEKYFMKELAKDEGAILQTETFNSAWIQAAQEKLKSSQKAFIL